jgi:transcriptional regulator with XRE-family HTH domain
VTGFDIHELRCRLGWSSERLAAHLGVASATIHRWENGSNRPRVQQLLALQELAGTTVSTPSSSVDRVEQQQQQLIDAYLSGYADGQAAKVATPRVGLRLLQTA